MLIAVLIARLIDPFAWLIIGITVLKSDKVTYWVIAIGIYSIISEIILTSTAVAYRPGEGLLIGVFAYSLIVLIAYVAKSILRNRNAS